LVWWFYRLWSGTWRVQIEWEDPSLKDKSLIFAHWHRDELAVLPMVKTLNLATMTSTSKDGQLIDFVIRKFGGATSKGSSTRGGVGALKGLVRLVKKEGRNSSMAVDGPKGPIYEVKNGIFELAKLTGATIIPAGIASAPYICFEKSWNKARLPKPFAKVSIYFSKSLDLDLENIRSQSNSKRLGDAIANACERASNFLRP